jgi:hypothetical protein
VTADMTAWVGRPTSGIAQSRFIFTKKYRIEPIPYMAVLEYD